MSTALPQVRHFDIRQKQSLRRPVTHSDALSLRGTEENGTGGGGVGEEGAAPAHRKNAALCVTASLRHSLEDLAQRVVRLSPDRRDPEQFHMEKAELAHALRRLARAWRAA